VTPVVFVHGFMGGGAQWAGQRQAFAGAPVVTLDLPGFGAGADLAPLDSITAYARWVLQTLEAQGITRFHLVGHSMGGMIAQQMVAQAAERVDRLVLYGTGAKGVLPGRFEPIETSKERARTEGAQATARRIAATWFLQRDAAPAYEACAQIAEQSRIEAILAGLDAMQHWDGGADLAALSQQTLVVWGDRDRTYTWAQTEHLWHAIARASLAVIPGSAHASHLERPALFNTIVSEFLLGD